MTREQLIQLAAEYAKQQGWHVADYTPTNVVTRGKECSVTFTGESKKPGDHFTVYLECKTGKVLRLVPGR
jgi:hypothetical protein